MIAVILSIAFGLILLNIYLDLRDLRIRLDFLENEFNILRRNHK